MNSSNNECEDKNMKFHTVIITKNTLIVALISAIAVTFIGIFEAVSEIKTEYSPDAYKNIIDEGAGTDTKTVERGLEILKKIIGFDINEPQTIVKKFSGTDININEEEKKRRIEDMDIYEEAEVGEPSFPSGEEINTAHDLSINNATEYDVDIEELCSEPLGFSIDDNGPQVLVMHTHTTECYNGDQMSGETERTTDAEKSVVAVGNVICNTLEEYGIKSYHDTTFHDYPSYQGSYTRALTTINTILEENPSIKVVLDVHRDAFVYSDGTKLTVSYEGAEYPTARVMLVSGTDSMGLYNPNWRENLKFAAKIQNAAQIMYPGFMRSINLRTERFNLHTTTGSLIIEVGSNGNTLEEAKNGARNVARAIAAVLAN